MDDASQFLQIYAETGSEQAFRELVKQNLQMVNATALRLVANDAHLAQDVAQLVFTDLACKAASLPRGVILGGWLHRHTCFTATKVVRAESRRRARERTAMEIQSVNDASGMDEAWAQMAPVLDDALNRLDTSERDIVVLRYLQRQDVRSIGEAIGASENAVQKRLGRALEKLRDILIRRGVTLSTALLASRLDLSASTPVPPGLATTVSNVALGAATTAHATFSLTTLKTMITSKLGLAAASVLAIAGVAAAVVTHNNSVAAPAAASSTPAPATAPAAPAARPSVSAPVVAAANPPASSAVAPASAAAITPPAGATESHSSFVQVSNDGTMTSTTSDNGVVQTQTRRLPASGMVVAGNGGGGFGGGTGQMPAAIQSAISGPATSTTVNADGSTTNTYTGPNGEYIEVTTGADGKTSSMKSVMMKSSAN